MANTVTIRFDAETRRVIEEEALRQGIGISTFVRLLAEAELKRVRMRAMQANADAVGAYLAAHPTAFEDDDPSEWFTASKDNTGKRSFE